MTIQLFANNAKTTLAAPITSTQTTITVATGTGALFPNPTTGQRFKVTLVSSASASVYEICDCTSRSGDTLTVIRGQEGTSGQPFILNDIVGNFDTAAVMTDLVQTEQLQANYYGYAVAAGSANALTATIPSNLTAVSDGMSFIIRSSYANTGATTFNLTLGSTSTGVLPVVKGNNTALTSGDIPASGYPLSITYSATFGAWVLTDPTVVLSAYALINSQTFTGTPRVPTAAFNDNSTIIANTAWTQNQLANYAPIYNPTLTGIPAAPTASTGTNSTQIATTAFVQNNLAAQKLGLGITGEVWNNVTGSRSFNTTYYNPYSYPIMVSASTNYMGGSQQLVGYVNGNLVAYWKWQFNGAGAVGGCIFIVPPSGYYSCGTDGGVGVLNWVELY